MNMETGEKFTGGWYPTYPTCHVCGDSLPREKGVSFDRTWFCCEACAMRYDFEGYSEYKGWNEED